MKKLFIIILFLSTVISCTNNRSTVFEKTTSIEKHNWQRFDKLNFDVPINKNDTLNFYLNFQYNKDFKGIYLPVNISFYTPDGETRTRNYRFKLIDRKTNKKLGTTVNHVTTILIPIRKETPFNVNGICKVVIEKRIPKVDTYGIEAVGLKVIKSELDNTIKKK